jgi:hypothetical protein
VRRVYGRPTGHRPDHPDCPSRRPIRPPRRGRAAGAQAIPPAPRDHPPARGRSAATPVRTPGVLDN